jgi:hypothetical protein
VTVNFHPDVTWGRDLMIEVLVRDGVYRSQFETGTSNGGLTARPGGDRWAWESRIFGGAYDGADPVLRPKYGALNYRADPTGGSPRFGSCHLRLRASVLTRTTFCYPDSHWQPESFGTADRMSLIGLAEENRRGLDLLGNYVEAHVHGPLRLADDVKALVLDPCYLGTVVEDAARALLCPVEWHRGFRLSVDRHSACLACRGQDAADALASLTAGDLVTPRKIGAARRAGIYAQRLKRAWHCVTRFGHPSRKGH